MFKAITISRWFTKTWPLGVDAATEGRASEGEVQLSSNFVSCRQKYYKIVLAVNPSVSTKGEAGGFQQFNLFSLNTNLELLQQSTTLMERHQHRNQKVVYFKTKEEKLVLSSCSKSVGIAINQRRSRWLSTIRFVFSKSLNLELLHAAMNNSDGKTPTLQSTQESKGGVI